MRTRRRRLARPTAPAAVVEALLIAAASLAVPGPAAALLRGSAESAGASRDDHALDARLDTIAQAVRVGDAGALCAAATRAGRVHVDLPDVQGSYASGQLQVVLARAFDALETRSFAFDGDVGKAGRATAFARGAWVRRPRGGGAEVRDTLTFALRLEQGDWRIVEIRSSP